MMTGIQRTRLLRKSLALLFALSLVAVSLSMATGYPASLWRATVEANSLPPFNSSSRLPDNIVLTPASDMTNTITVTWRTSVADGSGRIQYAKVVNGIPEPYVQKQAALQTLTSEELQTDTTVHCHTAVLTGLQPMTTYSYRVGGNEDGTWSDYADFTTDSGPDMPVSIVYFGDTQTLRGGLADLLKSVEARHPETRAYMIGGDLVDQGDLRNQWDELLMQAETFFSRKVFIPVMGNHDFDTGNNGPRIFNAYFGLSASKSAEEDGVFDYAFQLGNAYFIVLNRDNPALQAEWLEKELQKARDSGCGFKVVACHYPPYHPKKNRSNRAAQKYFVPLFDRYGVDLMLSGHDHSYMRSKKMRGGEPTSPGESGTVYIVANASDKHYEYIPLPFAECQFTNTPTYQILTFSGNGDPLPTLQYASYDKQGTVLDSFVIEK